jgi:hypothetical protein
MVDAEALLRVCGRGLNMPLLNRSRRCSPLAF